METLEQNVVETLLFKKDNNLDQRDNLDTLPTGRAIYGVFGRINGKPVNCRHVGIAENLREAVKSHYNNDEPNACFRTFMQSIKIKFLVYQLVSSGSVTELERLKNEWKTRYSPECNDELNRIH